MHSTRKPKSQDSESALPLIQRIALPHMERDIMTWCWECLSTTPQVLVRVDSSKLPLHPPYEDVHERYQKYYLSLGNDSVTQVSIIVFKHIFPSVKGFLNLKPTSSLLWQKVATRCNTIITFYFIYLFFQYNKLSKSYNWQCYHIARTFESKLQHFRFCAYPIRPFFNYYL